MIKKILLFCLSIMFIAALTIYIYNGDIVEPKKDDYVITTSEDAIMWAFKANSASNGYVYKGSDNDFHYFVSRWGIIKRDDYFKIAKENFDINDPFNFEENGEVPVSTINSVYAKGEDHIIIFGSNKYYTLQTHEPRYPKILKNLPFGIVFPKK